MPAIQDMRKKRLCRGLPPIHHAGLFERAEIVIEHFCDWLAATPLSTAFQTWVWFVPLVQTVHILCISVIFVAMLRIGVRLFGGPPKLAALGVFLQGQLRAIWAALAILLVTGTLLTITEPARELLNWVFRTKMILVLVMVAVIAATRHFTRDNAAFGATQGSRALARCTAIALMALGAAIITAGRWIAYV